MFCLFMFVFILDLLDAITHIRQGCSIGSVEIIGSDPKRHGWTVVG